MSKISISSVKNLIEIDGDVYEVLNPDNHKLKKDSAYFHGRYVYIYGGKIKDGKNLKVGHVYTNKETGGLVWVKPQSDEDKQLYSMDRIERFNATRNIQEANDESNFKEIDENIAQGADKYFTLKILETDDIFKRIVKRALMFKKICLKTYRAKFKNDYDISNMRHALIKSSPMSNKYFHKWAEILRLDVEITVHLRDSEGKEHTFTEKLM